MKKLIILYFMFFACSVIALADSAPPAVVGAGYHTGYIPDGFDTNDKIEIVGEGIFPNSCYRPATVRADVDHEARKITLFPRAYQYQGYCLQMMIPFDQTMELGILRAGTYQIVQSTNGGEGWLGALKVRVAANSSPDDFLYAPISQAYFENAEGNKARVKLAGEFTNSCMRLVDVMVSVQPNVIVLQPISELQDRRDCVQGRFPFEKQIEVANLKTGRYLLHVRSLNGKSINTLVDAR